MEHVTRIGMDTSKHIFQLHGVNALEHPVLRRRLRRKEVVGFFSKLSPTIVAIEACGGAHDWARVLERLGHEVRLIAPQFVRPYVKRGKNDAADAEALCEAMSRPTMRFVPVKTAEQQVALMLAGTRERLIARRTQLGNAIRGYAAEFGLVAATGTDKIEPLLARIAADETVPVLARDLFAIHAKEYAQLRAELEVVEAKLNGLAPQRRLQPAPDADSGARADRRHDAGDEDARSERLPLRPAFRGMAGAHAEGPFHRRQDPARHDHPRR